jgi:hypothetical protein
MILTQNILCYGLTSIAYKLAQINGVEKQTIKTGDKYKYVFETATYIETEADNVL